MGGGSKRCVGWYCDMWIVVSGWWEGRRV